MALLQLQSALARLYFDAGAREALREGGRGLADEFGLTDDELDRIRRLLLEQTAGVEIFAVTLGRKREERLSSFYPLTEAYLGADRCAGLYARYTRRDPLPPRDPAADALAFGYFLETELAVSAAHDAVLRDLLVLERAKTEVSGEVPSPESTGDPRNTPTEDQRPRLKLTTRVIRLHFGLRRLRDASDRRKRLEAATPPSVPVLVFRSASNGEVRTSELGRWLASALDLADGTRSAGELLAPVGADTDRDAIAQLHEVLTGLGEAGAIEWSRMNER
jgi:hypothetical protein